MNVLITGNLGYVGPGVVREFRRRIPSAGIYGYDIGYFAGNLTTGTICPEIYLNAQHYGDVRHFPERLLEGMDAVVSLAAISNDPIGNLYEKPTMEINYEANVRIAELAKKQGVSNFVFASSCSVYGAAGEEARQEESEVNPLTAYARSKISSEQALQSLATTGFQVTCLRFATACGMSDRLRLDLVLNDFVAGAMASGKIDILSDGTPWRPLINVRDMARAIFWASQRTSEQGGPFLIVNTGSNHWNYQVKDLAYAVQQLMPEVTVSINKDAVPDKRSYRVNFDRYGQLAPEFQPLYSLNDTVADLRRGLESMRFSDKQFRNGNLMRLNVIRELQKRKVITAGLNLSYEI